MGALRGKQGRGKQGARLALLAVLAACTHRAPAAPPVPEPPMGQLSQYMRKTVNVPFTVAMIESEETSAMSPRLSRAASVLGVAAKGLRDWKDLPGQSDARRQMFFAYAMNLEKHVDNLQTATADPSQHLEAIRQACNACHRFFRPNNRLDVSDFHRGVSR